MPQWAAPWNAPKKRSEVVIEPVQPIVETPAPAPVIEEPVVQEPVVEETTSKKSTKKAEPTSAE